MRKRALGATVAIAAAAGMGTPRSQRATTTRT